MYQSVVALVILLLSATGVAAQTEGVLDKYGQPIPADEDMVSAAPVVADVLLYNLSTSTVAAAELSGSFTLMGRMGQENDIVYGVAAYDTNGRFLDARSSGEVKVLAQGEVKELEFTYAIPKHLAGEVVFMLVLENRDGMLLGFREAWRHDFGDALSGLSCELSADSLESVECTSDSTVNVSLEAAPFSVFGERIRVGGGELTAGQSIIFTPEVAPGRYNLYVVSDFGSQAVVPIKKEGAFGTIMNFAVYKNVDGMIEATVPVFGSGLKDAKLEVSVTNEKGEICFEKEEVLTLPVFIFNLPETCGAGLMAATFTAADGTVFDTKTEPYSTGPAAYNPTEDSDDMTGVQTPYVPMGGRGTSAVLYVLLIVLLIAIAGFFAHRLKKPAGSNGDSGPTVPPTALTLVIGFIALTVPIQSAQAVMLNPYLYSSARGEYAWSANVNVTLDKASYAPGETATIRANGQVYSDAGASNDNGNSYVYYYMNSAGTYAAFDNEATGGALTDIANVTAVPRNVIRNFSGTAPLVISPSLALGTHSVRFVRATVAGGCYATSLDPCGGSTSATTGALWGLLGFTVTAPNNTPTANAGSDRTITLPTNSVTISGASEADSDGNIVSRAWAFVSGPTSPTITGGTTLTPTFSGLSAAGTYVFRLTVTDNGGATASDLVSVSVFAAAPACGWEGTAYLGAQASLHNTTKCSSPLPTMGSEPQAGYCDSAGENGTTVVCCDSGADCYRYTCNYGGSCTASVQLNFQ